MIRQLSILSLFLICCCNLTLSQQQHPLRPLPRPLINIACDRQSILRTTGLVRPTGNQQLPTTCTYTIIANNFFVCQMRLDFVRFSLPQPTVDTTTPFDAYPACNDGYLQVGNIKLCGENTGQHIYVPINPKDPADRTLTITVVTNGNAAASDWQITVNQLDCPFGHARSMNRFESVNSMSATNASEVQQQQQRPIRMPKMIGSDWVAPQDCLQYYVEPQGMLDSFNFNDGKGPYIGDMNYAICFRRTRQNRSIQLTRTVFKMAVTDPDVDGLNEQCFEIENGVTTGRSEDYLFIPAAVVELPDDPVNPTGASRRIRATRYCGTSLTKAIGSLVSSPPGPFQLIFNSDRQYYDNQEVGFRFQYSIV